MWPGPPGQPPANRDLPSSDVPAPPGQLGGKAHREPWGQSGSPRGCGGGGWGDWAVARGTGHGAGPLSRASLCPGQGAGGSFPPRPSSPQTKKTQGRGIPTHTPPPTHTPMQKVPRTTALGSCESARPSNTAQDLSAHRAPGDPMPTAAHFLLKLALPTRGMEQLLIKP